MRDILKIDIFSTRLQHIEGGAVGCCDPTNRIEECLGHLVSFTSSAVTTEKLTQRVCAHRWGRSSVDFIDGVENVAEQLHQHLEDEGAADSRDGEKETCPDAHAVEIVGHERPTSIRNR